MYSALRKTLPLVLFLGVASLFTASAAAAPAHDARGFLYGRITARGGSVYEGRLRWNNTEEAFWGDFFNAEKKELPYFEYLPREERQRRKSIEVFGIPIGISVGDKENEGRQLVARFGDLRRIEVERGDDATVIFKNGVRYEVNGGSNDLEEETEITVWDRSGEIRVRWEDIRTIDFLPVPAGLAISDFRLRGTVQTDDGTFRGYIQWDQDECLSSDELDGETRDGKVSLRMGEIRSIERHGRNKSEVVLHTGRKLVLDGTNDVDSSNRGIYVHDWRFGRVLVNWDAFRRIDFDPPGDSGPAYADFRPGRPLFGKVSTEGGKTYRGRLVYDLDEADTMEFLNGQWRDVEYSIPFARIAFILPERGSSTRVIYKDGQEVKLADAVDVDRDNAGVLVFEKGRKEPRYIAWEDVRRVDFE